ncbi:MAG TPA: homoserine kinase [Virgibacillus sp.]|nr:homoserine kinase [Virgibacillus sp.]
MNKCTIIVPASSANIGPGFDSLGMAMNRYLTLEVSEQQHWEFEHRSPFLPAFTNYEEHFIYKVALQVATIYQHVLSPYKVVVHSDIPLARGLGSSASAVIAGIELANQCCKLALTIEEKVQLATKIEGHPDNVTPALIGGFVITAKTDPEHIEYLKTPHLDLDIVLSIPTIELKTDDARNVLPTKFTNEQAASASSICNLMIASLLTGHYELAGKMMEKDLFHEPYRAELIPNYQGIKKQAKQLGAYGTVISGAGPTMISFVPKGEGETIAKKMQVLLPEYDVDALQIDQQGLRTKIQ